MKSPTYLLLSVALCAAISAWAGTEAKKSARQKSPKTTPVKQPASETDTITLTTGTLLTQEVRQSGQITDGPNQVLVYNSDAIRRSGASDLASFLKSRGAR